MPKSRRAFFTDKRVVSVPRQALCIQKRLCPVQIFPDFLLRRFRAERCLGSICHVQIRNRLFQFTVRLLPHDHQGTPEQIQGLFILPGRRQSQRHIVVQTAQPAVPVGQILLIVRPRFPEIGHAAFRIPERLPDRACIHPGGAGGHGVLHLQLFHQLHSRFRMCKRLFPVSLFAVIPHELIVQHQLGPLIPAHSGFFHPVFQVAFHRRPVTPVLVFRQLFHNPRKRH